MSDDASDELDWFGRPLRPGEAVPCPRCGSAFRSSSELAAHVSGVHGLSVGSRRRRARRWAEGELPASLGRNHATGRQRALRSIPLWVVLFVNLALVLVGVVALDATAPEWWVALRGRSWWTLLLIPTLWPTVAFMALRD